MSRLIICLTLCFTITVTPALYGQTKHESTEKLAELLMHRRDEVRMNAFQALYEQARTGQDLSTAREALRGFANMQHQDHLTEKQSQACQLQALKILVMIDDGVAQKIFKRTSQFVDAYLALQPRGDHSVKEIYPHIMNGFDILRERKNQQLRIKTGEMAERLIQLVPQHYKDLLPILFLKYPEGRDRLKIIRNNERINLTKMREYEYDSILKYLYQSRMDDETLRFLLTFPQSSDKDTENKTAMHVYVLGLLAPQHERARTRVVQVLRDDYESRNVRSAAGSGILAAYSTDDKLYWEANACLESLRCSYHNEVDFGPEFSEEIRETNHKERHNAQQKAEQVKQTQQKPVTKPVPQPVVKPAVTKAAKQTPQIPRMTSQDSLDFQRIFRPLLKQIRTHYTDEGVVIHLPRTTYTQVEDEIKQAENNGREGLVYLLNNVMKNWKIARSSGRLVLDD